MADDTLVAMSDAGVPTARAGLSWTVVSKKKEKKTRCTVAMPCLRMNEQKKLKINEAEARAGAKIDLIHSTTAYRFLAYSKNDG